MSASRSAVFISATSRDLKSYREGVRDALLTAGIFPVTQEHFPPDYRELVDFLRDKIAECDAVICIVGWVYGAAPSGAGDPPRSYSQIEYDVACELGKRIYVLLATEKLAFDQPPSDRTEDLELQKRHREALVENHKCESFSSPEELRLKVTQLISGLGAAGRFQMFYLHPPMPPSFFAGRVEELAQLGDAVRKNTPSIIVVLGMGGQGKTTLVYQWLRQQEHLRFAAGLWCTAYRGGFSFDMFLDETLGYLLPGKFDKRESPDVAARSARLLRVLQQRPTLLVIDGLERWLTGWNRGRKDLPANETVEERAGYFSGLDDFLADASGICNGTHFILTTRAIPAALDNADYAIVPVYDQPDNDLTLKGLDPDASVALLRRLGVKGETDQIKRIAEGYANHPLALMVFGGLLRKKYGGQLEHLPKVSVLDSKRGLFKLFEEIRQNLVGGTTAEQLVRVASHSLENPTLAAVAAAMAAPSGPLSDLMEQAITLSDWHLIGWDGEAGIVQLHPLVKQYFSGLVHASEAVAIHERFSTWYSEQPILNKASSLEQIRPRVLAIEHALRANNVSRCRELFFLPVNETYSFAEWLAAWGHQTTGIELLGRLAKVSPPQTRAEFLTARAAFQRQLGALEDAHIDLDEAIELLDSRDTRLSSERQASLAGALTNRGNVRWQASRLAEAVEDYDRALSNLDQLPLHDPSRKAQIPCVLMNRGIALREMGRFSQATVDCSQALQMYRDLVGSRTGDLEPALASALINRGNVLADQQRHEEALQDFAEAIQICERLIQSGRVEMSPLMAHAQVMKAATLNEAGQSEDAIRKADEASSMLRRLINEGRSDLEPLLALSSLGRSLACIRLKRWRMALDDCDCAIRLYSRLIHGGRDDLTGWLAHALVNRSEAHYEIGNAETAAADRVKGLDLFRSLIERNQPETCAVYLRKSISAAKYLLADDPAEAVTLLRTALAETERELTEGHAVEALRIEARRGLGELALVESALREVDPHSALTERLRACARAVNSK